MFASVQTSLKGGDGGNSSLGRGFKANASSEALKCKHRKHVALITGEIISEVLVLVHQISATLFACVFFIY